jgi:hypothetical protein
LAKSGANSTAFIDAIAYFEPNGASKFYAGALIFQNRKPRGRQREKAAKGQPSSRQRDNR